MVEQLPLEAGNNVTEGIDLTQVMGVKQGAK